MSRRFRPTTHAIALTASASLAAFITGCGYSARDEFLLVRGMRFHAGPGDGSAIVSAAGWLSANRELSRLALGTPSSSADALPAAPGEPAGR